METYTNDNLIAKNDGNDISLNDDVSLAAILYRLARYELIGTPEMIEERLERQTQEVKESAETIECRDKTIEDLRSMLMERDDTIDSLNLSLREYAYRVKRLEHKADECEIELITTHRELKENGDYKAKCDMLLHQVEKEDRMIKEYEIKLEQWRRTACEYKEKLDKALQDVEAKDETLKAAESYIVELSRDFKQATQQVYDLIKAELQKAELQKPYQPTGGDLDENES